MEKPLALLIPGLDGTGRLYYRQLEALSASFRVVSWKFSHRSRFNYSDLVAELDQFTNSERSGSVTVVGESFGGTIAMQFALSFPERVSRLVLINTFPVYRRKLLIRLACILARMLEWPLARSIKGFVVDRTLALEGISAEDRRHYREIIRNVYLPAYCRRLELVRDLDLTKRLADIRVPTLIFASGKDKVVPSVAEGHFMESRIPKARLFILPRAGHALLLTPGFSLAEYLQIQPAETAGEVANH